jgi:aspartate aminotransferase-like enzyme
MKGAGQYGNGNGVRTRRNNAMKDYSFVMTPGPTEIPLRVLQAMLRPAVSPGAPDYIRAMDEVSDLLEKLLQTAGNALFFPGSGRLAIESAITSILDPGDRMLTVNGGVFGKWVGKTVELAQGENVQMDVDWRRAIDPDEVRKRLAREKRVKAVAVVHNETSTGVLNPVKEIGKIVKEYGAIYMVDTVSSAGGDVVKTDDWLIDLNCTGNYKCMNCPPGLAIVAVSENAWASMAKKKVRRSFSQDLYKYLEMWIPPERGGKWIWGYRRHVVEPVPHITYALLEALRMIMEEGPQARFARNALAGRALRAFVKAMGLELYPLEERYASNTLTTILNNTGIQGEAIVDMLWNDYGVLIGGGLEEVAGKVLRIAHMGTTSDSMHVLYTVEALEKTLARLGWKFQTHAGLDAAVAVFDGHAD